MMPSIATIWLCGAFVWLGISALDTVLADRALKAGDYAEFRSCRRWAVGFLLASLLAYFFHWLSL